MQVRQSGDQRFVADRQRRMAQQRRLRLVKWVVVLIALGAFYYLMGHGLVLRAMGKTREDTESWAAGAQRTMRHIQERDSIEGLQRR